MSCIDNLKKHVIEIIFTCLDQQLIFSFIKLVVMKSFNVLLFFKVLDFLLDFQRFLNIKVFLIRGIRLLF